MVGELISGGLGIIGGLLGQSEEEKALQAAQEERDKALEYYNDLPEYEYIAGTAPILEQIPEEIQAAMISEDPTLKATEMAALQKMQELTDKGMSTQDAYNYMKATERAGVESRGQQEAIIDEMARKGMSGSGTEYALRSKASQSAVDQFAEQQALEAAKKAEIQALANMQQAQLAGNIRGEDYKVNSANTNALNQFAQENSRNKIIANQNNVNRQNLANQNETVAQRDVAKGNVDLATNRATNKANIATGNAAYDLARGVSRGNLVRDIGSTVGTAAGNIYDYYNQQR